MSCKFIFPPFAEHAINGPHAAPYLLDKKLRENHIESAPIDLNIRFIRKLLLPENISFLIREKPTGEKKDFSEIIFGNCLHLGDELTSIQFSPALTTILQIIKRIIFNHDPGFIPDEKKECRIVKKIYNELINEAGITLNDILCFSVAFGDQLPEAVRLARKFRSVYPGIKTMIGGTQVTLLGSEQVEILKSSGLFDIIFIGEALAEITPLVKQLQSPDVSRHGGENACKVIRGRLQDINFSDYSFPVFNNPWHYIGKPVIPVVVSKGCYWGKCVFCDYIRLSGSVQSSFSIRPVQTVLDEITCHKKNIPDADFFLISDAVPPGWYRDLAGLALNAGIRLNTRSYLLHSGIYDKPYFELLEKAGISSITFGTESLDNRVLELMGKNFSAELALKNIHDASGRHFNVVVNIIPDFPGSGAPAVRNILKQLQAISSGISSLNIQEFALTAGTVIAMDPGKFGITIEPGKNIKTNHGFHSVKFSDTGGMFPDEKKQVMESFHKLSAKVKLNRRVQVFSKVQIPENAVLVIDPTVAVSDLHHEISVWSLNVTFQLSPDEFSFINTLLSRNSKKITVSDLKAVYRSYPMEHTGTFSGFLSKLINKGIFIWIEDA